MTAKERIARDARRAREAPPDAPTERQGELATVEPAVDPLPPSIEFEDRSDEDYRAAVLEVMAALDWVRQQRSLGNLPN